jgi:lipooligosaccharide transport system permease protein
VGGAHLPGEAREVTIGSISGYLRTTPIALASGRRAVHMLERNIMVYRRGWIFILSGFFEPFFYLLSIGLGLSHLVGGVRIGSVVVPYAHFVAPGLLASSAMNGAVLDTTYNLFFKLKVTKIYVAVLATPLSSGDVALGEIGWSISRGALYSTGVLCVMASFGLITSPWALLCLPVAVLVSLAFAAAGAAITSFMRTWQDLSVVALAMLPMFLFSGTFFQLSVYPHAVATVISLTPLYQGVTTLRALTTGAVSPSILWHLGYLAVMGVVGVLVLSSRLERLLTR